MLVVYFPYLNMKDVDEVNFGDFKVWNFDRKANEYIKNKEVLSRVRLLLEANVTRHGTVSDIGVFSCGKVDFREYDTELLYIREARLLTFLTFLSKNNVSMTGMNAGHYVATSDNFINVFQRFQLDNDYVSEESGYVVRKMAGGYRVGKINFPVPPYVTSPGRFSLDYILLYELLGFRKNQKRIYERLLRATELVFEAYYNNPTVSVNARILLLAGAFEVLLDLPEQYQRKVFKEAVRNYVVLPDDFTRQFSSERGSRKVNERDSIKIMWADKFFTLRNHIIHGERVKIEEFVFFRRQRHVDIAVMFFVLMLKKLINEKLKRDAFMDVIKWGKFENGDGEVLKGFVYKDLSSVVRLRRLKWT